MGWWKVRVGRYEFKRERKRERGQRVQINFRDFCVFYWSRYKPETKRWKLKKKEIEIVRKKNSESKIMLEFKQQKDLCRGGKDNMTIIIE